MDAIPVFSQVKSLIQSVCGQNEEAKQTQINFSRLCPIVSQVRSLVESASGDQKAAKETQMECGRFVLNLVNGVPVVGHIKGGIHYAFGDSDGGDAALKAASHTSGVMAGGAVGFLVGGPAGAVALGIGGGAAMDATITVVDTKIKGKLQPYGFVEPLADPKNAGKWCDAVGGIALDGLTGHATGTLVKRIQTNGTARAAGRTAATAVEDDLILRTVRSGARPFAITGLGNLIVKLIDGTVYLLKDGRLKKIQDIFTRMINTKATMGHVEFETPQNTVHRSAPQFVSSEFCIKISGAVLEIYEGDKLVLFIKENKVYIKDASGNDVEVQEDHIYTKCPTGEVEEIKDRMRQEYLEECIMDHEEFSDACSVIDAESVYEDSQDIILNLEEEDHFIDSDPLLLQEHQGLANSNTPRGLTRGTN